MNRWQQQREAKRQQEQAPYELLLDEYYSSQDAEFLSTLRHVNGPKKLAALADRMKTDPRPWVRDQIMAYLADRLDRPGHHPLVKRLFKHAEQAGDHELMAHFAVAFDALVRRRMVTKYHYDWSTRQTTIEERLSAANDSIMANSFHWNPPDGRLFSPKTRLYLRRRAWRYFRRLGFQKPGEYLAAVTMVLRLYTDEHLETGANVLDRWSLLQIGYHDAKQLRFGKGLVQLADDAQLADLRPAPYFLELWQSEAGAEVLLDLARDAQAHLVRLWATQMLQAHHQKALESLGPDRLAALLSHPDDCVQSMALDLLRNSSVVDNAPITFWLQLLQHDNPGILPAICELMAARVAPDRLDLEQCVTLTCTAASPVAAMGFGFLQTKPVRSDADRQTLRRLATLTCDAQGGPITAWALPLVGGAEHYSCDAVCDFLDSLQPAVRDAAWTWLLANEHAAADAVIWARLTESPWDDIRGRLIAELERRANVRPDTDTLTPVWTSVLLAVHRGSRRKPQAIRQVATAIATNPARVDQLLPVLAVAVRSLRGPEMRAGLAAVVSLIEQQPELAATIQGTFPELTVHAGGSA